MSAENRKHSVEEAARSLAVHGLSWPLAHWLAELDARLYEIEQHNKNEDRGGGEE